MHKAAAPSLVTASRSGLRISAGGRPSSTIERDRQVAEFLRSAQSEPPASWNGTAVVRREHAPAYFQYPAMMSPAVQRDLLRLILAVAPECRSVLDPFCGSGTVLSESMYQGLECWASDLNPLAVLLCHVKTGEYDADRLRSVRRALLRRVAADRSLIVATDLWNWRKWFRVKAAQQLSAIRRAIRRTRDLGCRRFFWACLAETVRLTSNSRTSTYKLHIRPITEIKRLAWPIEVFKHVSEENIGKHRTVGNHLKDLNYLSKGRYFKRLEVHRQDAATGFPRTFDILMTSPPYGDNVSTVPYGQNAYLPLHWIDLEDIDSTDTSSVLDTTHEIDRLSLGGERPRWKDMDKFRDLRQRSPSLNRFLRQIAKEPHDRTARVVGFVRDLGRVLPKLLLAVRVDGYLVWTVGNRRVGGREVPLADILSELLCERSAVLVGWCTRRIPQKRMAIRNSISPTMRDEHLLVFRRVAAKQVKPHG